MKGCEGLNIEHPVMIKHCGSGAGWSSDQDMDDVLTLPGDGEELDENSVA